MNYFFPDLASADNGHKNCKIIIIFQNFRKAVRAAVVLLPLLGITNIVNMMEAPLDRQVWEFAVWSYTTHFLTSFQGLFVAVLYCFLNGEVYI